MAGERNHLADRLRGAREAARMTQEEVAQRLGVSRSAVTQMELGGREVSSVELDRLAYLYGKELAWFLQEREPSGEAMVAVFRAHPDLADDEQVREVLRRSLALGRELANLEGLLGLLRDHAALASYDLPSPRKKWDAVQQGEQVAEQERRRLGLGMARLPNVGELLEAQGAHTVQMAMPDEISGLTLVEEDIGVMVVVNNQAKHAYARRRFSFAHEYCHVLVDRRRYGMVSRPEDRDELVEVRANAFAAEFLMPSEGIRQFVHGLGKGRPSRLHADIFDEHEALRVRTRPEPGSQEIQLYDVVQLAHHFGASRLSAIYRLKNLGFLSQAQCERFLEEEKEGVGLEIERLLGIREPEMDQEGRTEFERRYLGLSLEAYRRQLISRSKLEELGTLAGLEVAKLATVLSEIGLDEDDGDHEPLVPSLT